MKSAVSRRVAVDVLIRIADVGKLYVWVSKVVLIALAVKNLTAKFNIRTYIRDSLGDGIALVRCA